MAKTHIELDFSFCRDQLKERISSGNLTPKEGLEVYYGFHALKAWRWEFEETNGRLESMVHHSNPDDPPDLVFQFSEQSLSAELTAIEPHPYGQARALRREKFPNQLTTIPPLSGRYESKRDIELVMFSKHMTPDKWETVAEHEDTLFTLIEQRIARKIEKLNARSLDIDLLILDGSRLFFDSALLSLGDHLCAIRKDRRLPISDKALLLIHSQSNPAQYCSFTIYADGSMKKRSVQLIPEHWLVSETTMAELESENLSGEQWKEFTASLINGDQLWRFRSQEDPLFVVVKFEGIAILRNGEVVTSLITRCIELS
jgi:hypothetical protein